MNPNSEEERMRKFMEALGLPSGSPPAPKRVSKQVQRPVVAQDSRLPKARDYRNILQQVTKPEVKKFEPPLVPQVQPPELPHLKSSTLEESNKDAYAIAPEKAGKEKTEGSNIRAMFKSSENIRRAILLREILGPPRSLLPF